MMHLRWLALSLSALMGCASTTGSISAPRLLPSDLRVGALDQRTRFELDDQGGSRRATEQDASKDRVDTPHKQRRRKILYITGLSMAGFGVLGFVGFGVGGRIVQAQMNSGYEDGTLTRDRRDRLDTTGTVMNGLAIGSAVVGLAGIIMAATTYGIDHARCGDLSPRRKDCVDHDAEAGAPASGSSVGGAAPRPAPQEGAGPSTPSNEAGTTDEPAPRPAPGPAPSQPAPAGGSPNPSGGGQPGSSAAE